MTPPTSSVGIQAGSVALDSADWSATRSGDPRETFGRRVFRLRTLVSFALPLAVLYLVARSSLQLDLSVVWERLRGADSGLLILALVICYSAFIVRTLRWQALLANAGFSRRAGYQMPSFAGLCEILFLSFFVNTIAMGRLGDAYRAYMLKKAAGVSLSAVLGTILTERLIDVAVLAAMMGVAVLLAFHGSLPIAATHALAGGAILAVVGVAALLAMRRLRPLAHRILPTTVHRPYARFESGVVDSVGQVPLLVGYSAVGWLIEGLTLYCVTAAVSAPLSVPGALVVAMVASLLSVVPLTPAGLGFTESGVMVILSALGVDPASAGAIALLNRAVNYWSITGLGAIAYFVSRKR
jgi:uncharacterized protein (TIRG00374 family)